MANYTVKLVDHTGSPTNLLQLIQQEVQSLFDEALSATKLTVAVSWGQGAGTDNYVVHFIEDIPRSYLKTKWPQVVIDPNAGGHTYQNRPPSGSEVYKFPGTTHTQFKAIAYAKQVLHEFFHNQFPYVVANEVHGTWGGGGLAAATPVLFQPPNRINQRNKELIERGFKVKIAQLL